MSSILTGSTTFPPATCIGRGDFFKNQMEAANASGVAVAERLFAKRAFDAAGDSVPEPDDGSKEDDGKHKKQSVNHESSP